MPSPNYFAACTDSGFLLGCDHQHMTVVSAVVCAQSAGAGAYVVAVEDGALRQLNDKEEREFQLAMYGPRTLREKLSALTSLLLTKPIAS
jgi:hypothetical protein